MCSQSMDSKMSEHITAVSLSWRVFNFADQRYCSLLSCTTSLLFFSLGNRKVTGTVYSQSNPIHCDAWTQTKACMSATVGTMVLPTQAESLSAFILVVLTRHIHWWPGINSAERKHWPAFLSWGSLRYQSSHTGAKQ